MKKILALTFAIIIAVALTAAPLAVPSYARSSPAAALQQGGELELLDQFGDIPATQQSISANTAPMSPERPDNLGTVTQIGYLESGTIHDLAVQGNYAYAGFGSTIVVIDITDPANMQRVASLQLAGEIQAIEADQGYLYVSSSGSGLWIVDIQNPLDPVKTGLHPSNSTGVLAVQGDFAYLAANYGLEVVDISARDDPRSAGFVNDLYPLTDIAVKDDFLYLAEHEEDNIWILDITNPIQPVYAGQYTLAQDAREPQIEISNSILYYQDFNNGLQVLDITAPAEPKLMGSLQIYPLRDGLAISGDTVYLAFGSFHIEGQGGFEIIDVSDPSSPTIIGTYSIDSLDPTSIAASGGNVFLTHTGEVQSIDASLPSAPILVDSLNSSLNAPGKIAIAGDYAYIIDSLIDFVNEDIYQLSIVDISNPYQPIVTGQLFFSGTNSPLTDVEISGNIVIVTQSTYPLIPLGKGSVYFIDVSNPQNPVEVGRFDDQQALFYGIGVQGEFVYAAWIDKFLAGISGIYVLNISDPTNPEMIGIYDPPEEVIFRDVILDGDYAYIPSAGSVLDVSDPEEPVKVGEFDGGDDIALDGNLAYLASYRGVIVLDVSNPANPVEISSFGIQGGKSGVAVQENYLYVSSESGLSIVDVSHPMTPTLAAFLPSMEGHDVSIQGKEIFFTSSEGFQILHLTGTISGVVKHPNRWPVPDVTILANGIFSATTTSTGAYAFEGLEPGSYSVVPSITGFRFTPGQYQLDVPPSRTANFTMLPLPVSVELTPGAATTLVYTDTQGLPTSFIFPSGLVSATTTATVTPTLANPFFSMDFAGHAFDLSVRETGSPTEILTFTLPVSVTIRYSPMDTATIYDAGLLALYRRDGDAWVKNQDTCSVNPTPVPVEEGVFHAAICQAGRYALFGPTHSVALPLISYGSDAPSEFPPP